MAERVLFLDDNPERAKAAKRALLCTHVATGYDCIHHLSESDWDAVYLDHDLGGEPDGDTATTADERGMTGMDVARYLCMNRHLYADKLRVVIHSLNGPAATMMASDLHRAGYQVERVPFTRLLEVWRG